MAFENKTVGKIRDLLLNAFQAKFNRTFRLLPKAFLRVLATVLAGIFITLYKQIGWLFLQLFPDAAYFGEVSVLGKKVRPLVRWGMLIGVGEPKPAMPWRGTVVVTASVPGTVLFAGTELKSAVTGKSYLTEESVRFTCTQKDVPIVCAESGTTGDLVVGDALTFVSPPGVIQKNAVTSGVIVYGVDDESESDYRLRVSGRFRSPPQGGALADYRIWAMDVDGVLNAYPYHDPESPAGVLVYVAGHPVDYPYRLPDAALLERVAASIASRKPLCAIIDPAQDGSCLNIRPIAIVSFAIDAVGLNDETLNIARNALTDALEEYFYAREPFIRGLSDENAKTNAITRVAVIRIIDQTLAAFDAVFVSVRLRCRRDGGAWQTIPADEPYILGMGELACLAEITAVQYQREVL
jgi:uncharacterized phage protein gp47/JayE